MSVDTIQTIIDEEIGKFSPIDQQRLISQGVYDRIMSALNEGETGRLLSFPGDEIDRDFKRDVEKENVNKVRKVVAGVIQKVADEAMLG